MKRKVSLLLALIMIFSIVPVTAFVEGSGSQLIPLNEKTERTDVPLTPTLVSKTANSLTVENRDENGNLETGVEWMLCNTYDEPITGWVQGENGQVTFDGLTDGTRYFIYARYAENDNRNASDVCAEPLEVDTVYAPKTIKIFGFVSNPQEYLSGLFKIYLADQNDNPTTEEVTTLTAGESNAKRVVITLTEDAREKYYLNGYPDSNPSRYETAMSGSNSKSLNAYSFATTLTGHDNGLYLPPDDPYMPRFSIQLFEKKENSFLISENGAAAVTAPVAKTVSYTGSAITAQGALQPSADADYIVIPAITDTGMLPPAVCWKNANGEIVTNPVNIGTYDLYASLAGGTMWKETPETPVLTLTIEKAAQAAPGKAPEKVSATKDSITVKLEDEKPMQFAIDDGSGSLTWHNTYYNDTYTFTGLEAYTKYNIVARYAENDNQFASPASAALEAQTEPAPQNIGVLVKCGDQQLAPADFKVYEGNKFFDWELTGGEEATITVKLSDDAKLIYKPNTCSVEADGITAEKGACANGEYNATIRLNDYTKGGTVTFNLTEKETISVRVSREQVHFPQMQTSLTETKSYDGKAVMWLDITYSNYTGEKEFTYFIKNDKNIYSLSTDWYDARGNKLTGANRNPVNVGTYKLITEYQGDDKCKPLAKTVLVTLTITPVKMKDPVAPMIDTVTKDSISYAGEQGQKYIVTTSETAPAANDADWKECTAGGSMTELGLNPNTQYYIHTFVPALNGNYADSDVASVSFTTKHSYGLEVADETTLTWNVIVGTDVDTLSDMKKYLTLKSTGTGAVKVEKTNYSDGICGGTLTMIISPNDPEQLWEFFPHKNKVDTSKAGTVEYTYNFEAAEFDSNDPVKKFKVKCVFNVIEQEIVSFTNFEDVTVTYGDTYNMETAQPNVKPGAAAYNGELEYTYTDANGVSSTQAPLMAGTYTVTVKIPSNELYYTGRDTATLIIEPKEVELTGLAVKEKIYDGTTAAEIDETGATLIGVLPGDEALVNFNVISATFNNENVTEANTVTVAAQLEGSHKNDYKLKPPAPIAATIKPREVSLVITAKDKVYDGTADAEVTASYAEHSGMLDADAPFVTLKAENGAFADKNAGENKVVTCTVTMANNGSFTVASNYTLKYDDATAAIRPKDVFVTFKGTMEHVYDGQSKQVTALLEGILESDAVSVTFVYGTDTTAPILAGDYLLTAKDLSNSNYKLADDPYTQEAADRTLKIRLGEYTPDNSSAEKSIGYADTEEKSYDLFQVFGINISGTFEVFLLEENEILAKHALASNNATVQLKDGCIIGDTASITYTFIPAANTYKSFPVTLHIKVAEEIVERTEVLGAPDEVTIGTELDYSGITLQVTFQSGQIITFDNAQYMHSGYSTALTEANLGTQTLTLTANANGRQYAAAKDINVKDMLTDLELEAAPAKTEYTIGETALDLTGGKVKATYKSGAQKTLDLSDPSLTLSEVTDAMLRTLGEHDVTVSCTEEPSAKTSFRFTVVAAEENPDTDSDTPGAGDAANPTLWFGLIALSLAGIAAAGIAKRKLKRKN